MDQKTELPIAIRSSSDLGTQVREERRKKNLSQADLAARAGVSRRFIYQLENGTRESFPLGKVLQVIRRLNLELKVSKRKQD